jgi:hypothetical protein
MLFDRINVLMVSGPLLKKRNSRRKGRKGLFVSPLSRKNETVFLSSDLLLAPSIYTNNPPPRRVVSF